MHPADLFIGLHSGDANAFWLDREAHPTERFSVMGAAGEVVTEHGIDWLRAEISADEPLDVPFTFRPGHVGFLSYEGEATFMRVDRALVLDHDRQYLFFIGDFNSREEFELWHHAALLRIGLLGGAQAMFKRNHQKLSSSKESVRHSDAAYLDLIARAQDHIRTGDVYQLCLTNQITAEVTGESVLTFLKLRELNPAPFAVYLRVGDVEIISCSPEQFVSVTAAGRVSTKPIKGTRRRSQDRIEDARIAEELRLDPKERAENLMIVDLMRNDLSRVSKSDSVVVSKLFEVESYATVHQLVSTVESDLSDDATVVDLLESCFPGGSMTGAPKIRAIELLRDLEGGPRGIYSGVIGSISAGGAAEFAMVIRTIVVSGNQATIGVGGGITIDSVPARELEETKIKAAALLSALEAGDPWLAW